MTEIEFLRSQVNDVRQRMASACHVAGRHPSEVLLCGASKARSADTVRLASDLAIDMFGENRVQELTQKLAAGAYQKKPVHFIGNLQTNKVKQVVGKAELIHSVGSAHLLKAIDAEAQKQGIVQPVLLQVNIADELSKGGVSAAELPDLAELAEGLPGVTVHGLMCIPPQTNSESQQRAAFSLLRQLSRQLADQHYATVFMRHLSMGMSGDFEAAIAEGATIVRVGTYLFGERAYP